MIGPLGIHFSIAVERSGARAVVTVEGELDLATAPKLARTLEGLDRETSEVVLDLEQVWFVDMVAVRRLLRAQSRLEAHGRRLALTAVPASVSRMLELTGFGDAFIVLADSDEAFVTALG